jgi:hypothetical protein
MQHPELREIEKDSVKVTLSEQLIFKLTPVQLEEIEQKIEAKLAKLQFLTPAGIKSSKEGRRLDPLNKKSILYVNLIRSRN